MPMLIRFSADGRARLGLYRAGRYCDLTELDPLRFAGFPAALRAAAAAAQPLEAVIEEAATAAPADAWREAPAAWRAWLDAEGDALAASSSQPGGSEPLSLLCPVEPDEVWAAGVTYERSRDARVEEALVKDIYTRVYEAERPELFLKATGARVVGPGQPVRLRRDSSWMVPEPELGLVLDGAGAIAGFTIGNDMSARDIEGENPLYLPQAKVFRGACALGPAVALPHEIPDPYDLEIRCRIWRGDECVFDGAVNTARLKRTFEELIRYLGRDNPIFPGTVLLTGTGIVPPDAFTLHPGDVIDIAVPGLGVLCNPVAGPSDGG
ncbi:MAG TPA: fumarylacetoacetate hydrolase family protein [Limnochordia bacterium]